MAERKVSISRSIKKKKKLINFNLISSSSLSPVSNDKNHFFIDNNEISKILNDENFTREEKELIQTTNPKLAVVKHSKIPETHFTWEKNLILYPKSFNPCKIVERPNCRKELAGVRENTRLNQFRCRLETRRIYPM